MPTTIIFGISVILGHLALKINTINANKKLTIMNLTASILKGPASLKPSFAATNALAHKKINKIFRIKSNIVFIIK